MSTLAGIASLYTIYQSSKGDTPTNKTSTCDRLIYHNTFYYWVMLPSAGIIVTLMFFVRRMRLYPRCLGGRPGILIPMNFLDNTGLRLSYAAVFGLTATICMKMLTATYPIQITGPAYVKVLIKLATMLLYGFAFYPLLAAITAGSFLSLGLGTLYTWMFFIVNMIHLTDCVDDWSWEFYMQAVFVEAVPELLCSVFLSIAFPFRFTLKLIKKIKGDPKDTQEFFEESFQAKYVRQLLKPAVIEDDESKPKLKERLVQTVKKVTYTKVSGFRYSPRILATYTAGIILLYLVAELFFSRVILILNSTLASLERVIDAGNDNRSLSDIYDDMSTKSLGNDPVGTMRLFHHLLYTLLVVLCVAGTLVSLLGLIQIALGLRAYRDDLLLAYKGDFSKIGPRDNYSSLMVAFVRYSGYQVAYVFWAFILQFVVIFLVLAALAYVIFIPIIFGRALWFFNLLKNYWPVILISIVISVISTLAAKFVFLRKKGQIFAINNRRLLFCVMYFLFFYNVFVGLFSCLLRMLKALGFGLFFLSRLDCSTLPKAFERMDPGFKAYVGLVHVENAHTHPVLVTFVNMVKEAIQKQRDQDEAERSKTPNDSYRKKTGDNGEGGELVSNAKATADDEGKDADRNAERHRKAMKAQWFLAYTLIHNLPLRATRKHYLVAEREKQKRRLKKQEGEVAVEMTELDTSEEKKKEAWGKADVSV